MSVLYCFNTKENEEKARHNEINELPSSNHISKWEIPFQAIAFVSKWFRNDFMSSEQSFLLQMIFLSIQNQPNQPNSDFLSFI